ncbi:inheritance of peroxisomes protein 1-domain-containing protein [Xylaria cubensis]|nr:inheritance of peroxisomes protein 1-domain-containing protein [Xylaria cubensis]
MESLEFAANAPETPRPRRVMTAPVPASMSPQQPRPSSPSQPAPSESEELVETLYSHPSVRIISFTSSRRGFTTSLPAPSDNDAPPGSLPPSSRLERTIAIGAFRIYRAPGSVAFLSCGSALQPILPRSQCWCINEDNSRFVLQIRRPQYWRIEVPVADPDDAHRAVLLREVFDKILLFEKTECPFERSFTIKLPDPETPVKKKAWTAEGKHLISSPFDSDLSPPADTPTAISRGKRATGTARDMSPGSARFIDVDEAQDGVRFRARNQSFGDVLSYFNTQLHTDVTSDTASTRSDTHSSRDDYHLIGASAQTITDSPTLTDNFVGDSAAPPSVPNPPTTRSPYFKEQEESNNADISRAEGELEAVVRRADRIRESVEVSVDTTPHLQDAVVARSLQQGSILNRKDDDVLDSVHSDGEDSPASFEGSGGVAPVNLARKRVTRMLAGRSFTTVTPPSTLAASPAKSNKPVAARKKSRSPPHSTEVQSRSASTDSFHSIQSWHSSITPPPASPGSGESSSKVESVGLPRSPSPGTYSPTHITTPKNTINVVPSSSVLDSCSNGEPTPRPVRFVIDERSKDSSNSEGEPRMSRERFPRRRSHAGSVSGRRALSPLPSAANLFTPPPRQTPQSRLAAVRRLPAAIMHKTMEILLSPPSHLIKLMLKVAAMIMAGEWRGLVYGLSEEGEQIPVQWDYYSDGEFSDFSDSDDYTLTARSSNYSSGVPRAGVRRRSRWANDDDRYGSSVD